MKKIALAQMREKQKGKIVEIQAGTSLQNRLLSLGVYPGKEITKLSQFALRGPIAIKAGRTVLALGFGMAGKIIVELE
jgi:Fe2+ transport system protein FeoA